MTAGKQRQADPPANLADSSAEQVNQSIHRTPSFSRLSTVQHRQLLEEHNRKLKERRIAELTAQLESTIVQDQPQQSQTPPVYFSSSSPPHMKTVGPGEAANNALDRNLKPGPATALGSQAYFTTKDELLLWRQKQKEAEDLNARIETLRRSGMPEDQLPSPVRLPITPLLADIAEYHTGSPAPTKTGRFTRPSTPLTRASSVCQTPHGLGSTPKRPPSKTATPSRTLERSPGLIMTAASAPAAVLDGSHLPGSSSQDQSAYFNALKDAEDIITHLRSSHDNLLIRVTELESQLDQLKVENKNLQKRNQLLEGWLADSETEKARAEDQRQRAKVQAEAQSRREVQARADAQVRADKKARAEAQARAAEAQGRAEEQARTEAQAGAHRPGQIPQNRYATPTTQPSNPAHQLQSREAQLRAKLQLKDLELGKQFVRQPFNLGSHPEFTFANGPPLGHSVNGQRLKRYNSFSGPQPRPFREVYAGMSENEALQIAMEKHREALQRVQGIYSEEVYGEVEWPLNGHGRSMTYGPNADIYHETLPVPRYR